MKSKNFIVIIILLALIIPLYVFSPALTDSYYVADHDVAEIYPFVEKLHDDSILKDWRMNDRYLSFFHNSRVFFYSAAILRNIMPLAWIYNFVLPILISIVIGCFSYGIGTKIGGRKLGLVLGVMSLVHVWSMENIRQSIGHSIGLVLIWPFLYFMITKKDAGAAIVMILAAALYPPAFVLMFVSYVLYKLAGMIQNKRKISSRSMIKPGVIFVMCLILISLSFRIDTDRVSKQEAMKMPEFHTGGLIPVFQDNLLAGIFSRSDDIETNIRLYDLNENFDPKITELAILLGIFALALLVNIKNPKTLNKMFPKISRIMLLLGIMLYIFTFVFLYDTLLYAPARYLEFALVPFLLIASGVGIYHILTKIKSNWFPKILLVTIIFLLFYAPFLKPYSNNCKHPELYDYANNLPDDSLIAGNLIEEETTLMCIPLLAKKKVLSALTYTTTSSYYKSWNIEERRINEDMLKAYYSTNPGEIRDFCSKYGVSHIVLSSYSFSEEYLGKSMLNFRPYDNLVRKAIENSEGNVFYLEKIYKKGELLEGGKLSVLDCNKIIYDLT